MVQAYILHRDSLNQQNPNHGVAAVWGGAVLRGEPAAAGRRGGRGRTAACSGAVQGTARARPPDTRFKA